MKRKYDTGDIVGPYTLIEYCEDTRKAKCKCNTCGRIGEIWLSNAPKQKMCVGCRESNKKNHAEDLTGKRFGRLTVRERAANRGRCVSWNCLCDCGNKTVVTTSHLKNGHTQSCGCYMRDRVSKANSIDLIGQRYGKLTAIKRQPDHITIGGNPLTVYECVCDCGNHIDVLAMNLVSGNTQSCGCLGNSRAEIFIKKYLTEHKIKHRKEYTYKDLLSDRGYPLKFDFALLNKDDSVKCLVEYNGEQHYYPTDSTKEFGKMQRDKTDAMKRDYCKEHGIKLIVIRYDDNLDERLQDIMHFYNSIA